MPYYKVNGTTLQFYDAKCKFYKVVELLFDFEKKNSKFIPTQTNQLHSHTYYEFHFMISGSNNYDTTDNSVHLDSGEFLIFTPGVLHQPTVLNNSFRSIVISLSVENTSGPDVLYKNLIRCLNGCALKPLKISKPMMDTITALSSRNVLVKHSVEDYLMFHAEYSKLIHLLYKELRELMGEKDDTFLYTEISDVMVVLDNLINHPEISLSEIAEVIGYSERNTSRLIFNTYGMSLTEIRHEYAMNTAKKLLSKNSVSINEVAAISGFKSVAAMRNSFIKYEGITPTEYRNKHKEH